MHYCVGRESNFASNIQFTTTVVERGRFLSHAHRPPVGVSWYSSSSVRTPRNPPVLVSKAPPWGPDPEEVLFRRVAPPSSGISSVFGPEFGSDSAQHRAQNTLRKPEKTERFWGAFSAKFRGTGLEDSAGKHFGFCAAGGFRARSATYARLAAIPAAQRSPSEVPEQLCRAAVNQAPSWGSAEGRETSQNSLLRRFFGRVSARSLWTSRREGFATSRTAGERRIAPSGCGIDLPCARRPRGRTG